MASFEHDDIQGKTIIDFGTGTGRLAIGAALLNAKHVTGVDIDTEALRLAQENAILANVQVDWKHTDIMKLSGSYDTVLMNPPYGTRVKHADKIFLEKSFQLAPIIYSIHKSSTRHFVYRIVESHNRKITDVREIVLKIPHLFDFHKKKWADVDVDLYRITQ
jgi:putative methylase